MVQKYVGPKKLSKSFDLKKDWSKTFFIQTYFWSWKIIVIKKSLVKRKFWDQKKFGKKINAVWNFFWYNNFLSNNFHPKNYAQKDLLQKIGPKSLVQTNFDPKQFETTQFWFRNVVLPSLRVKCVVRVWGG